MNVQEALKYMYATGNDVKDKHGNRFSPYHEGGIFIEYWDRYDGIVAVDLITDEEFLNGEHKDSTFFSFELK